MKLVRFGNPGTEKPGLVDADGAIRDVSGVAPDFAGAGLSPAALEHLRSLDPKSLPLAPAGVRLGAPVAGTRNFIAVGLNFADHAKETKQEIPPEPILFSKAPNCIVGAYDDVMYPQERRQHGLGGGDRLRRRHARALRRREGCDVATSPASASATTCPSVASR